MKDLGLDNGRKEWKQSAAEPAGGVKELKTPGVRLMRGWGVIFIRWPTSVGAGKPEAISFTPNTRNSFTYNQETYSFFSPAGLAADRYMEQTHAWGARGTNVVDQDCPQRHCSISQY